jgi:hypothetical protein
MRSRPEPTAYGHEVTQALRDWLTLVSRAFVVTASTAAAVAVLVFAVVILIRLFT